MITLTLFSVIVGAVMVLYGYDDYRDIKKMCIGFIIMILSIIVAIK